jgi:O-acetyl-ADP-ribose deacetylase (regulator of RNase III)
MIVASTMTAPEQVESRNCYRALRAVLRIAGADAEIGQEVYCPGLATGVGMVPPGNAAAEMALAYGDWKRVAKPGAAPKGGPTAQLGNSGVTEPWSPAS